MASDGIISPHNCGNMLSCNTNNRQDISKRAAPNE
jgi:hypothetical protein